MKKEKIVLVVEDEKPLLQAIVLKLEKVGIKTFQARRVSEALRVLRNQERIDAIWLDHYLLGGENGLDFVVKIKADEKLKRIPIFLVSNTATLEKVESYLRLGIKKYYTKSNVKLDEIVQEIKKNKISFMKKIKRILVIEDEESMLRVLKDKMEINQFEVDTARDGEEGLEKIKRHKPDIILLDLMMPKVSGETVLKKIKENSKFQDIPVIVISAKADDATINNCLNNLGANDFMVKSNFTLNNLLDKIKSWK